MSLNNDNSTLNKKAEMVREACINAAKEGFLDASISGLCNEGAIEAAISSIQNLDLSEIVSDK